jgi:hypothetical protein
MFLFSLTAATATPTSGAQGDTTGWATLFLMAMGALLVAGLSILYLVRRFGREMWDEGRRRGPLPPPPPPPSP